MFDLKYATAKMIIVDLHTPFSRSWVNVGSKNYIIADSAQAEYCTALHCLFVYRSSSSSSSSSLLCSLLFQPWNIYWSFTPIALKFCQPTSYSLVSYGFKRHYDPSIFRYIFM